MIWVAIALAYIGIGGLVAVWMDHRSMPAPIICGAIWLPLGIVGLGAVALHMASGAAKPRR